MFTRRQFIARGAVGAGGLVLSPTLLESTALGAKKLPPFLTPLPIPAKATPIAANRYRLRMAATRQRVHSKQGAELTRLWGYDDGVTGPTAPGPTIEVRSGVPVQVDWVNDLPRTHLFGIDPALTGGDTRVRSLTHLHGGEVSGTSDGNPYATPLPGFLPGQTQTAYYPNEQRPATTWYHDHALGITRLNVMAGLAGYYVIRDDQDTGLESNPIGLPGGRYEVPLAIQDRMLDGVQLAYPAPPWMPEFFGDTVLVNGAVWPYLDVEPRKYRFRVLNGSNARFYHLELSDGPGFAVIGTDGGMLDAPVPARRILLAPGERLDVVVDFRRFAGQVLTLRNAQLPKGTVSPAPRLPNVMQFRVGTRVTTADRPLPAALPGVLPASELGPPSRVRDITLEEVLDAAGAPIRLLLNGNRFEDPVTERPRAGATEDWRFINLSADTHPMHLHLVQFQVVERRPFDVAAYQAALDAARAAGGPNPDPAPFFTGPGAPPPPEERGWKDTVRSNPGEVTRIRALFDIDTAGPAPQRYVYHCHILEHEDNDMMRPYEVV